MTNSEISSSLRLAKSRRTIGIIFLILSFAGFLDATYLTIQHYAGGIVPCSNIGNCEKVLTSAYSVVAGVPVALFGSVYYFLVLLLSVLYLNRKEEKFLLAAARLSFLGFVASLWFIFAQLFLIHAICLYCMGSATSSTILFICGVVMIIKDRRVSRSTSV